MFTHAELDYLADSLATRLRGSAPLAAVPAWGVPRRMNVAMFGACVGKCPEVVKRRIRSKWIDPKHVEGRRGSEYLLDRAALAKFNVTLEVAAERLRAWQSPAQTLAPVPHTSPA